MKKIAITIGDAAGIGPELALKGAAHATVNRWCEPLIYGHEALIRRVADHLKLPIPCEIIDCGPLDASNVLPGQFSIQSGLASYETFCAAVDAALEGTVDAVVTGPIQKEAWNAAGITYPGHTECLADRVHQRRGGPLADVRMMLTSPAISCVLETIHVPLGDVPGLMNVQSLIRTIELAGQSMTLRFRHHGSLLPPRITVLGLNPHAGEHGLFSHGEEETIILPAIEAARQLGWEVTGPLPPDTAFTPAMRQRTDVYVCMYHDQGLIPLKALSFDDAVNVTLGLPVVRTSVDHGTAMDLAWRGVANDSSMIAAIRLATELGGYVPPRTSGFPA